MLPQGQYTKDGKRRDFVWPGQDSWGNVHVVVLILIEIMAGMWEICGVCVWPSYCVWLPLHHLWLAAALGLTTAWGGQRESHHLSVWSSWCLDWPNLALLMAGSSLSSQGLLRHALSRATAYLKEGGGGLLHAEVDSPKTGPFISHGNIHEINTWNSPI